LKQRGIVIVDDRGGSLFLLPLIAAMKVTEGKSSEAVAPELRCSAVRIHLHGQNAWLTWRAGRSL
jgi:hypothetical protein